MEAEKMSKYVFADWSAVEPGYGTVWPYSKSIVISPYGIRLQPHKPYIEKDPVILPDKPWESSCVNSYATFLRADSKIKVWYETFSDAGMDDMKSNLAYAESEDGIHFTKPKLNLIPFNGDYNNNLVKNVHGTCVLYDKTAEKKERYKLIWVSYDRTKPFNLSCTLHGAVSEDGITWNELNEVLMNNPGDTQNILEYDDDLKKYVIYTRQIKHYPIPRRSVSRTVSNSFNSFPEPDMILNNDPCDPPDWDYYTSGYHKWPGASNAHLMLMDIYKRTSDTFDVHLLTSRDGIVWYRPMGLQPYIDKNSYGCKKDYMVSSTKGIIDNMDGTWSFYINSIQNGHNIPPEERIKPAGGYRRAVIREDGFMSLTADSLGCFYTIKLDITQNFLMLNAEIPYGGWIKVSIVDKDSCKPIDGFDEDSCDPIDSKKTWNSISWKNISDLSSLKNGTYRLKFTLFKSKIYAFSI